MRRYTLPCEIFVLETQRPRTVWKEPPYRLRIYRLSHSKQLLKIFTNDVSTILFTDEKIFTLTTPKNTQNDRLYAHSSIKKKQVMKKTPAHTINVRSLMTSADEWPVIDIPVWHLSITESKLVRSIKRNMMLLQQMPAIRQISTFSSEFIFQQEWTVRRCTRRLTELTFFTCNFVWRWPISF